jgi:hypothetical protein
MSKKCIYCGAEISDTCVIDFCEKCGVGVFGKKMFDTIVKNMEEARENGDLCHNQDFKEIQKDAGSFGRNW